MGAVLLRAVAASLVLAILVPGILFLTVHKAGIPKEGIKHPPDFYEWSPHRQNEWNLQNLDLVGGLAYVRERMKHPAQFAEEYAMAAGSIFAVCLASCLLFAYLSRSRSSPG